jgi:hypothetical protein
MQHGTPGALIVLIVLIVGIPHTLRQQLAPLATASELLSVFGLENKSDHRTQPILSSHVGFG